LLANGFRFFPWVKERKAKEKKRKEKKNNFVQNQSLFFHPFAVFFFFLFFYFKRPLKKNLFANFYLFMKKIGFGCIKRFFG
jgi:hypothetical protein